jgi:hypothetical protein
VQSRGLRQEGERSTLVLVRGMTHVLVHQRGLTRQLIRPLQTEMQAMRDEMKTTRELLGELLPTMKPVEGGI